MVTVLDRFINFCRKFVEEEKNKNANSWIWKKIKDNKFEVVVFYLLSFFFGLSLLLVYILLGN